MVLSPDRTMKVALPKNHRLLADLCTPRFRNTARGLIIEEKADIKKRLGRSPDRGDAVCSRASARRSSGTTAVAPPSAPINRSALSAYFRPQE